MSDSQVKRAYVYDMYPSPGWQRKVSRMSDAQVVAIYLRDQEKQAKKAEEEKNNADPPIPF